MFYQYCRSGSCIAPPKHELDKSETAEREAFFFGVEIFALCGANRMQVLPQINTIATNMGFGIFYNSIHCKRTGLSNKNTDRKNVFIICYSDKYDK